jgi:hypothetical protein
MKLFGKLEEKYSKMGSKMGSQVQEDIPTSYGYVKLSNTKKLPNHAKIFGQGQRAQSCINGFRPPYDGSLTQHTAKKMSLAAAKKLADLEDEVARSRMGENLSRISRPQSQISVISKRKSSFAYGGT